MMKESPKDSLIRSYGKSFDGFSAKLTEKESQTLKKMKGVVSVFPSRTLKPHTTRSWDFLGLPEPTPEQQSAESNVIVGVFDSGIWPESPSFDDSGCSPPPQHWKGVCQGGQNFTCNKKIIGVRTYMKDAKDYTGHGSHSASIMAGKKSDNTNFYGIGNGVARGGVPFSKIAIYKVCDTSNCADSNILAAFDDAIADGVDVISVSLGRLPDVFYNDVVAIGSFHATEKGILTVQSAGNSDIVGSVAPWIFSVAASTIDRRIVTKLVLGNGANFWGKSVNSFAMENDKYPLVHLKINISIKPTPMWDEIPVNGKIVLLDTTRYIDYFFSINAAGVVSRVDAADQASYVVPGPVVMLEASQFDAVLSYLNTSPNPEGKILKSEIVNDTSAPVVASYSSKGPNQVAFDILKPDITAPGVDILAAYSPLANVTKFPGDTRRASYNILTGTSVACPFVAATAAYVKSQHPNWSPSAIKSAIMTTSQPMSKWQNPKSEFAYGAGHLNPTAATNPGLVYEITRDEYIIFMCKLNYTKEQIDTIARNESFSCPQSSAWKYTPTDVNYPAMLIMLNILHATEPFTVGFQRTVTNVGFAKSTYTSKIESDDNIKVTVEPSTLSFSSLNEEMSFIVTLTGQGLSRGVLYSATLVWSDGTHSVRSPIGVYT
ncbi:hypothetical protein RND81_01G151700 [Saponaria officinalis]|uniref:Cucumisin n=1 Tax=Saponaria officinalis TaxID=3572 RepID=A0AAW1NIW4_SAPOF